MINKIYPCLWFDGQAKEAASLYCSIFPDSKITTDTPVVVQFEIAGMRVMGLNGGPLYQKNPSISFFVNCKSIEEIDSIWSHLIQDGSAMMPLDKYPWAEKYGWLVDKFGMTWQLMISRQPELGLTINPSFLFVGEQFGKGKEAIDFYTNLFQPSALIHHTLYSKESGQPEGTLEFGLFHLQNQIFTAMDGPGNHQYQFNEAISLVVECKDQEEIDKYWNALCEGGAESRCGWLVDKFGVSWQIIPAGLGAVMSDPERGKRAMDVILKMNKLDWATIQNA